MIDVHFLAIRKAHRLPKDKANEIETEDSKKEVTTTFKEAPCSQNSAIVRRVLPSSS